MNGNMTWFMTLNVTTTFMFALIRADLIVYKLIAVGILW